MEFDNPKVYGDTFISDGLVFILTDLYAELSHFSRIQVLWVGL